MGLSRVEADEPHGQRCALSTPRGDNDCAQAAPPEAHRYVAQCHWEGTTAGGYAAYSRAHVVRTPPAPIPVHLSADKAFGGDPTLLNPEQLLVAAAASCQLLSFLAVAARARVDVRSYDDAAEGAMPVRRTMWVERIELRPSIVVGPGTSLERLERLVDIAHRECFIASSLRTEIVVTPRFVILPGAPSVWTQGQ